MLKRKFPPCPDPSGGTGIYSCRCRRRRRQSMLQSVSRNCCRPSWSKVIYSYRYADCDIYACAGHFNVSCLIRSPCHDGVGPRPGRSPTVSSIARRPSPYSRSYRRPWILPPWPRRRHLFPSAATPFTTTVEPETVEPFFGCVIFEPGGARLGE